MMFDGLYPEQADTALNAKALRPPEPDPNARRFSAWGTLGAAPKGVAAGSAQALGSTADVAKGTGENWLGNLNGPLGRIPMFGAVQSLVKTGQDMLNPTEGKYTSEVGTSLRNVAQDYTPDPQTTHAAESAVFNLFRVGSKAITAAATLGNLPGAFLAGSEEGLTQADELARQGVDINTRTKVGAVTGAVNTVGFALPAAGKTWLQTGGLALAGGPASFMVQNAATREILQNADYSKLADQYDPFDPVGLTLSTVVPLGFGAMAMRGAKGKAAPAPDAPPKVAPPDDVVDAARVTLVRQQMDATNPVPERMDMADAHVAAYTRAMDQMAAGERVEVDLPNDAALQASIAMDMKLRESGATVDTVPDLATFAADNGMALDNVVADAAAPKGNAFIAWLKSVGGVSYAQKFDIVGERGVRGNYAGVFTRKGQNIDTLVESAVQAGYLSRADVENPNDVGGTRALAELIRRATTGEKIQTIEQLDAARMADAQTRATMDAVDAMEAELRAMGVDPSAAKGNPEVLGAYLSEHRTALVNRKLADIDAETKAERIAIGEAYDLNPKQIDDQARIALAQELDENAFVNAAMDARDEVDFLNRVEEIIRNAPGSRKTGKGGAGVAENGIVPPRNGEAATPRAEPAAAAFNPAALADQAASLLAGGKTADQVIGELQATGAKVPPELQNMVIGVAEFGGRVNDLVDQVKALQAQRGANAQGFDLIAQAVDNLRSGRTVEAKAPADPLEKALADIADRNPTALDAEIPIDFDANGKPGTRMTVRDYLDMVKQEAAQDAADANLIEVAATCFLSGGI